MIYARACRNKATGDILGVWFQETPYRDGTGDAHFYLADGAEVSSEMIDIGLCEVDVLHAGMSAGRYLLDRLEKHPLADAHEDAPKVRFKPDITDAPTVHFCPTSYAAIDAHLAARGQDALPEAVRETVRQHFAHTEHVTARSLRSLGYSFDEIKAMPRYAAARSAAHQRAIDEQQSAQRALQKAAEAAKLQARIDRNLNKGKP